MSLADLLFDLTDPKQQAVCFHYSNLQPMWHSENNSKNNSLVNLLEGIELDQEFLNRRN